jgi:uncharacterized protein
MLRIPLIIIWVALFHHHAFAISIASGSPEGTYYRIAQDIKRIAEKEGIPIEVISTNGSFDNINLLGAGKVDLAIVQLDVLKLVAEIMQKEADFNVFEQTKVVLNLHLEEIHVITRNEGLRSLYQLDGKKVAVDPERSGSVLTADVLLAGYDLRVEAVFEAPNDALAKLRSGELDAIIFVGGAPVPAFENLDESFRFVRIPANNVLEQIYQKQKLGRSVYFMDRRQRNLCCSVRDHDARRGRSRVRGNSAEIAHNDPDDNRLAGGDLMHGIARLNLQLAA